MSIDRVAFRAFGQNIYWYGILIALAVVLGAYLAARKEKLVGLPRDTAIDFTLWCVPLAFVGARLYYVAFEWERYSGNPLSIFDLRSGGLAIFGGIIGGALAALIVKTRKRIRYGSLADIVVPSLALGQAIGRWGNFFNQEAYGGLVTSEAMQRFPISVYIEALGEWHLAAFFYESVWCFAIWIVLEYGLRRGFLRKAKPGDAFFWYAALYGAERAFVEGLREDSLYWGTVRVSQAMSCVVLLAVAVLFFWRVCRACGADRGMRNRALVPFAAAALSSIGAFALALGLWHGAILPLCAAAILGIAFLYRCVRRAETAAERKEKP